MSHRKPPHDQTPVELALDPSTRFFANVAIDSVVPAEQQPRERFDDDSLASLTESIRRYGVLEPLLVAASNDGNYPLIAGERRWCAARDAGLEVVPVIVLDVADPAKRWLLALIENVQRDDLDAMDLARAIARCLEDTGMTHAELAGQLGHGRDFVEEHLALLRLPAQVQALIEQGKLNKHHARVLRGREPAEQIRLAKRAAEASLTAAELKRLAPRDARTAASGRSDAARRDDDLSAELENAFGCCVSVRVAEDGSGRIELRCEDCADMTRVLDALRTVARVREHGCKA